MDNLLLEINVKKVFSLSEAQRLVSIIYRLTQQANSQLKGLLNQLEALPKDKLDGRAEIDHKVDQLIRKWQDKVEKLGAYPKGIWLVDIDNGSSYYCWKFPEDRLCHQHEYADGFSKRRPLAALSELNENSNSANKLQSCEL